MSNIDDLREETQNTDRVSAATDEQTSLKDDLLDHITGVKEGTESGQVAIRDDRLTALANTLDERDEDLSDLIRNLETHLEAQPDVQTDTKAGLVALLARVGLQEAAPDLHEKLGDAVGEYARENL